jgi:chromosome segregation ATPase
MDDSNELRSRNKELERSLKELKEALEQKNMVEIKRRGEFAKQKQEVEILRSKERHLEAHVAQLEQMQAKTVSEYEQRIASSNSVCTNSSVEKTLKKQVKELEKKLDVSSAAMKQLGKSSLLMEKENERLKKDKNDLKLQLKKLVDCAEKFGEGKK